MVNLNYILAIFPEWGQNVPSLSLFGGRKTPRNLKMDPFCAPPFFEIWNLNKITMKSEHKKPSDFEGKSSQKHLGNIY